MSAVAPVKSFLAPVWIMLIIVLARVMLTAKSIETVRNLHVRHETTINIFGFFISFLLIGLALAEAILYWRIRNLQYRRRTAWIHLILMLISMLILPLGIILVTPVMQSHLTPNQFSEFFRTLVTIRFYSFWIIFIVGSFFFIVTIRNVFSSKDKSIEEMIDDIGTA